MTASTQTHTIKVYSRTVIDDAGTLSRYEYNGSFGTFDDIETATDETKEGWAKMMDCFFDVLFVHDGRVIVPYIMALYRD